MCKHHKDPTFNQANNSMIYQSLTAAAIGVMGVWNTWVAEGKWASVIALAIVCFVVSVIVGNLAYLDGDTRR